MSSCIAFCFLNYDKIIRYDIWNKFFENIDNSKYVVFIHPKIIKDFSYYYTFPYNYLSFHQNHYIRFQHYLNIVSFFYFPFIDLL